MTQLILNKPIEIWQKAFPQLDDLMNYQPILWKNPTDRGCHEAFEKLAKSDPQMNMEMMMAAEARWLRFAPLLEKLFPETQVNKGIIESELVKITGMKTALGAYFKESLIGELYLKCDNALPVAGSIKARGGIYEVLKHAETLALEDGLLNISDDYSKLAEPSFRAYFGQFSLAVGSTGNLGLSIGIMGAALGFKVTVHMSADAKAWKKSLLCSKGVTVVEYSSDYSKAVEEGRRQSQADAKSYFIDDENSIDLFMGYSVAAFRLKKQLEDKGIQVDKEHPLYVYLPCGVGGAPGGICFGLKQVFGDSVHCYFVEPTHSPCMLLGLMTGENDQVSVSDFGLDNRTEADGLAVGRPSGFVGKVIHALISGIYTVEDDTLYKMLALLKDIENITVEPSATPGLIGAFVLQQNALIPKNIKATHIAWATGGLFVPEEMWSGFYHKGKKLLAE